MIEKVAPRFVEAVQSLKYLTNASLSSAVPGAEHKTEIFRSEVTKTVRARKGWRVLLEDIAMEDGLFGFTDVSWLDEFTWFPKHFRQDEFFIPKGTKQLVDTAQIVVLKETYLPHELFRCIEDKEAAATVGWNIENTIKAVNTASPDSVKSGLADWSRIYEDLHRELSPGHSFEASASVITVYSLLAQEVDGKISHYRLADTGSESFLELFSKDDRFNSMEDCLAFYSFQKGNGTMHGSKGIGREIYELAGIIDRCRNEVVDRLNLSGKAWVQGDERHLKNFKMNVIGNAILIREGVNVLEQKIDGNVEGFLKLDDYLSLLVDQLIGAVSPRMLRGERVTAKQVELFASREEEGKDTKITRFLEQFTEMMGTIQKRLCDPQTKDEDAKAMQKRLLDVMSKEELKQLAEQPVAGTVADLTPLQRQQLVVIAQENRGNPLYNQRQLEKQKLTAQMGAEFAESVLLPENDPTESAEQLRMQQIELLALTLGTAVPVSPRDNHMLHLQVIMPLLEQTAGAIQQGQTGTATLEAMVAHANEHVNVALQMGGKPADFAQAQALLKKVMGAITQLHEIDAQAEQLAAESEALNQQMQPEQGSSPGMPAIGPAQM